MGYRAILPLSQTNLENPPFPRHQRECCPDSGAVALIAFLLLRMAQTAQKAVESPLAFARLVRANLMHRKRIDRLIGDDPKPRIDPNQMRLQWP